MRPIDPKTQEELAKRRNKIRELSLAFQKVFDSEEGKLVLGEISRMCKENKSTYVDMNPNGSAYYEGQRSIILGIRSQLNKTFNQPEQERADV